MSRAREAVSVAPLALAGGGEATVRVIVNPRARRISLRLDPASREVFAIAPTKRAAPRAEAFARERAEWIAAALARLPPAQGFVDGAEIPLRGRPCRLRHRPGRGVTGVSGAELVAGGLDAEDFARRVRRFLTAQARADLAARVAVHAAALGVAPSRIVVKDTRSRWGSCSRAGVLSFSWRVIFAPPEVLDYLAAHEVAHLREMNHSPRFWALVAKLCPRHAPARAWLRQHGAGLHAIGGAV